MLTLLEDLRCHIAGCAADLREQGQGAVVHDTTETEISNHDICIFGFGPEDEILRFEVPVDDATAVDIFDSLHDGPHKVGGIPLVVVALGAYAIKELATRAEVEDEIEVVCGLKVVVKRHDIAMALGDFLEDGNLVADHMLSALHELLVDNLAGIVLSSLDVHGFLDNGIGALAECAACAVLQTPG